MDSDQVVIEVGFGLDWDDDSRAIIGRMSQTAAQAAHDTFRPYCMLFSNQNGLPILLARVHTEAGYVGYTAFSAEGAPTAHLDYHRFGDVLALRRVHLCQSGADVSLALDVGPDGEAEGDLMSSGASFYRRLSIPLEHRVIPGFKISTRLPEEGWLDGETVAVYVDAPVTKGESGNSEATTATWTAPDVTPGRPRFVGALFSPGARLRSSTDGNEWTWIVQDTQFAGNLTLPTGKVVAADPFLVDECTEPFTVEVPPGTYPQYLAHVRMGDDESSIVAAAKLEITSRPTVTWEMGLLPGQDAALLGKGQFYGFGVDTGTGAFLDHCACTAFCGLDEILESADKDADLDADGFGEFRDTSRGTGANMITYSSGYGDGAYPVWIGRDEGGEVTCFVADMQVVRATELESRQTAPEPRYIEAESPDRASWAPTVSGAVMRPGATAAYFAEVLEEALKAHEGAVRHFESKRPRL
jgi:hypothetical protein